MKQQHTHEAAAALGLRPALAALLLIGALLAFAGQAHARNQGGYTGPGSNATTVKDALGMRDDAQVTLKGYIVQSLGGDKYMFKDDTGAVRVEIDHKYWAGRQIGDKDFVEIQGEVDRERNGVEIDVKRIITQ